MNGVLLVLIIVVIAAIALAIYSSSKASGRRNAASLADAKADARRLIERLGGQVLNLTGTDDASKQALADASERYAAASSQIDQATTARQAELAKESALEGLYYVRAARTAMGTLAVLRYNRSYRRNNLSSKGMTTYPRNGPR